MSNIQNLQYSTFETNDFEELQEAASGWDQEYFQMSPGKFSGRMELAEVGPTQIMREKWTRKLRYRGTGVPNGIALALPLGRTSSGKWQGNPIISNSVCVQPSHHECQLVTGEAWDSLVLSFSEDDARSVLSAFSGHEGMADELRGLVRLKQESANLIKRAGLELLQEAETCGPEDHVRFAKSADQFKIMLLWELFEALEIEQVQSAPSRCATIVQKSLDLAFADPHSAIGLTDICNHLGISLRSLHYAFLDATGTTPATWLRRVRLNHVERALKRRSPAETNVKRVAADFGFTHLGHFGSQYKRLFGKSPGETFRGLS